MDWREPLQDTWCNEKWRILEHEHQNHRQIDNKIVEENNLNFYKNIRILQCDS